MYLTLLYQLKLAALYYNIIDWSRINYLYNDIKMGCMQNASRLLKFMQVLTSKLTRTLLARFSLIIVIYRVVDSYCVSDDLKLLNFVLL